MQIKYTNKESSATRKVSGGYSEIKITPARNSFNPTAWDIEPYQINQGVNIVVYAPSASNLPLYMSRIDSENRIVARNSTGLLIPRWGFLQIQNHQNCEGNAHRLWLQTVSSNFRLFVRDIFRLSAYPPVVVFPAEEIIEDRIFYEWELPLIQRRVWEYVSRETNRLLMQIKDWQRAYPNLLIPEETVQMLNKVYERALHNSTKPLTVSERYASAIESWKTINAALYHSKLKEMPNIPDDNKYAIYVSLFLPILLPLFRGIRDVRDLSTK